MGLSSPHLIKQRVRIYQVEGGEVLRPNVIGRPPRAPVALEPEERELERVRRENERPRAEVAYLGKLKALMSPEPR